MTAALEGGEWSAARSGRTVPPRKTHFTGGWVGPRAGLVPTGIRSRTVQPVAQSLYRLSYRAHIYSKYDEQIYRSLGSRASASPSSSHTWQRCILPQVSNMHGPQLPSHNPHLASTKSSPQASPHFQSPGSNDETGQIFRKAEGHFITCHDWNSRWGVGVHL